MFLFYFFIKNPIGIIKLLVPYLLLVFPLNRERWLLFFFWWLLNVLSFFKLLKLELVNLLLLDVVSQPCNLSSGEAEAGGLLQVQGQSELCCQTWSQTNKTPLTLKVYVYIKNSGSKILQRKLVDIVNLNT